MAASTSFSLPKPHVPIFLPRQSSTVVMPLSAHDTSSVPLRWKTCEMFTILAPSSREPSALGTHERAKSACPEASTCCGAISTAPSLIVTFRPSSL